MSEELTERFIAELSRVESGGDVAGIADLFSPECEVGNNTLTAPLKGQDGAREFWENYRKSLGKIRSEFRNKIVSDDRAALEWTTKGDNDEINYEGVSILEFEGEKISRFFAYFNPAKVGTQLADRHHA